MDAIGYITLTNDISSDDGLSLAEQEASIRSFCTSRDLSLVGIERDAGVGDISTVPERLGFGNVLAACRDQGAQTVVVARLDRLSPHLILQEQLIFDIERFGGTLVSVEGEEISTERALVRAVLRAVAPHESALRDLWVRQRMSSDRDRAALAEIEHLSEEGAPWRDIIARIRARRS